MFKRIMGLTSLMLGVVLIGSIIYMLMGGQAGPPGKPLGGKSVLSALAMSVAFLFVGFKWLFAQPIAPD